MDVPEAMINTDARQMMDEFAQQLQMQGLSLDQYFQYTGATADSLVDEMKPEALKRIKSRLVLEAVVKAENIEATEEEFQAELEKMASQYGMDVAQIKDIMGDYETQQIKEDLAVTKAVELIVSSTVEK
jgi:trigger factor